jgi:GNAT superfamily N-acetyltransferase
LLVLIPYKHNDRVPARAPICLACRAKMRALILYNRYAIRMRARVTLPVVGLTLGHHHCGAVSLWSIASTTTTTGLVVVVTQPDDIRWKLRPPADTPPLQKLCIAAKSWAIHTLFVSKGQPPKQQQQQKQQQIVFPDTPLVVLEAWDPRRPNEQWGRFGITVQPGPSTPELVSTLSRVTGRSSNSVAAAAVVYMYVEPPHRHKGIGAMALQIIADLHRRQGCDCTILVADDKSGLEERTLVKWYERHGYHRAPELQQMMGSPDEKFGVAMIAPITTTSSSTSTTEPTPPSFTVEWWY